VPPQERGFGVSDEVEKRKMAINAEDFRVMEYQLALRDFVVNWIEEEDGIPPPYPDIKVRQRFIIESTGRAFMAMLRLPCDVKQDNRLLASYPDGLWQAIKAKLGLSYRRKEIRLSEFLVFPHIEVPKFGKTVRVAVFPELRAVQFPYKDDVA
jgi:hypothetical protein